MVTEQFTEGVKIKYPIVLAGPVGAYDAEDLAPLGAVASCGTASGYDGRR